MGPGTTSVLIGTRGSNHRTWVVSRAMTPHDDDSDQEHESQDDRPTPGTAPSTRLRDAAAGVEEAQAWKGQQLAKGWRKLVNALRRQEKGER